MTDLAATFDAVLDARWSCRAFRPDPVPRAEIEAVVAAATRVPTWCNAQPWGVVITEGAGTEAFRAMLLDALDNAAMAPDLAWPARYEGDFAQRRRACAFQLYDALSIAREDRPARAAQMRENFRLFGAPHAAVVTTEADLGPYGAVDTGGFVAAFTLAAAARGIGTIVQAAATPYAGPIRAHFGLPETRHILCMISFGWPDLDHPANSFRTPRAGAEEVITWARD